MFPRPKAEDILVAAADIESSCFYDLADAEAIMKKLRIEAMDRARDKAESLAAHAGKSLGAILSVNVHEDLNLFRRNRHRQDTGEGISGPWRSS